MLSDTGTVSGSQTGLTDWLKWKETESLNVVSYFLFLLKSFFGTFSLSDLRTDGVITEQSVKSTDAKFTFNIL